ncbi:MAG: hypothetical protein GY953_51070 [bacterium]|nr:hypothetical protein [bacterium]
MYEFGPFRYDAGQRLLFREGEVVPLVPKAVETLHVLLERRGRVVEKAELMRLVWPDAVVEEVGLARNISLVRKALGDEAGHYIETIPKRGYRFAAEASQGGAADRGPGWRRWRWLAAGAALLLLGGFLYWQFYLPSRYLPRGEGFVGLAVIPFERLTPGAGRPGFAEGFQEVLVAELSKLNGVHVISPSTVRRYQRFWISPAVMARLLGLEVILEGSIQQNGDRTRITSRLVDVRSGKLIWSESQSLPEQAADEVARSVASEVRQRLE